MNTPTKGRMARSLHFSIAALLVLSGLSSTMAHGPLHERLRQSTARIAESPADPLGYVARARLHREHRDLASARSDLQRALELAPQLREAVGAMADLLLFEGKPSEALEWACRAHSGENPPIEVRRVYARALTLVGQSDTALPIYDALLDDLPQPTPELYLERFRTARLAHQADPTIALRGLRAAIERIGPVPSLILPAVDLERELGQFDSALQNVARMREPSARKTPWLVLESEILLQSGRVLKAQERARVALNFLDRDPRRESRANLRLRVRADQVLRHVNLSDGDRPAKEKR